MVKRMVVVVFLIFSVSLFSFSLGSLKVSSPAGVVKQPFVVRTIVMPEVSNSTYTIGLEGHLELFALNISVGTFTSYPGLSFDGEVYVGFGFNLGGLYAAVSATVDNYTKIFDLSSFKEPKVALGLATSRKTNILFASWSRFELSYLPVDLILKDMEGNFELNENFDWTNANLRLIIESQDVGYFLFAFYTNKISEFMDGNYKYAFELALPSDPAYIYISQNFDSSWKVGLGLAISFLNTIGTYEFSTGKFNWLVSAQF
ncbi:MAG: hypothetical protein ABDH59_09515 [Fervidobacterium sp.]